MSRKRNRYRRKVALRNPLTTAMCGTEGENTEPEYIGELAHKYSVSKRFKVFSAHSDPVSIVKKLIGMKRAGLVHDYWFAVFDREFTDERRRRAEKAKAIASKHGIISIETNPTFELWLCLHFEDVHSIFVSEEDVLRELRRFIPKFEKRKGCMKSLMPKLSNYIDDACNRARLAEQRRGEYSSGMPIIIETLQKLAKENESDKEMSST